MKIILIFLKKIFNKIIYCSRSFYFRVFIFLKGGKVSFSAKLFIADNATFIFGNGIKILENTIISIVENGTLSISDNVIINHSSTIYVADNIYIGKSSRVSHQCSIIDHNYHEENGNNFAKKLKNKINIGENVWIGANALILKGVSIGDNSIIGAGTVVTKNIQANKKVISISHLKYIK